MTTAITKVVFPVAGLGTRFLPVTKAIPKEMLPIADQPLIQYAVQEAQQAGIEEFIFVTNPTNRVLLQAHFSTNAQLEATLAERGKLAELKIVKETTLAPEQVKFCYQDRPLGLGHAVWCAREYLEGGPFAVILPDDLIMAKPGCLKQMVDLHAKLGGNIVAVENVARELTSRYGILDVSSDDGSIVSAKGLVEKPKPEEAPSTLSIIGRYILDHQVFQHLDKKMTGSGGEIQLTDAISATIGQVPFHGLRFEGTRFDCGSMFGFVEANVAFGLKSSQHESKLRTYLKNHL
ncbi:UTP--glucose-1-phosphate uridylyltransferase [Magnetovibrio blakemorei]|uniref:UTP--glucose-1-phosphate uridylyltransferase n=1 Tax=Magnetovibrio blakemorei TaxID=28181 RepID=A0A1E5Q9B9_9PROT|nr:UTP--glucose-1-phosphate uridylyltransferase [Magnetovibrio blakemorei]OEJ68100.1 UTP--glucose-1-phosphate uridylyltransferase [Magnetovibrio blakemorei]